MRRWCAFVLAAAGIGSGIVQAADPLAGHEWRSRILLLYVPGAESPALTRFRAAVQAHACGVADRDLVVGEVIGTASGTLGARSLGAGDVRSLRQRHGVAEDRVATVLVGKDGGVKLAVDGVADPAHVFRRIDGMPMRKREMAEDGRQPCR